MKKAFSSLSDFIKTYFQNYLKTDKPQKSCLALAIICMLFFGFYNKFNLTISDVYVFAAALFFVFIIYSVLLFLSLKDGKHKAWSTIAIVSSAFSLFAVLYIFMNANSFVGSL